MRFTKTKLALATAGALTAGMVAAVPGLDAGYPAAEPDFATILLGTATAEVSNTQAFGIDTLITDLVIGRTTGFGIRMTLTGAEFAGTAVASVGADITGGVANEDWTLASSTIAANIGTFTVSPGTVPVGLPVGEILSFAIDALDVTAVDGSLGMGTDVTADIEFFDPVTATVLLENTATLYTAAEGTMLAYGAGDTDSRIDVGGQNSDSKTDFSLDGVINNGTQAYFHAGVVTASLVGTSSAGTTAAAWDNANVFQYNVATDTMEITVTGDDFTSFTDMWLEDISDGGYDATEPCNVGNVAMANASLDVDAAGTLMSAPVAVATGDVYNVCLSVDGTTIEDQELDISGTFDLDPADTQTGVLVDPGNTIGSITPLQYNGDVLEVHFFNDDGNVGQESRLRISNKGNTDGLVRIVGVDDAGVESPEATLTLAAGESVQVKSTDLINGTGVVDAATGLGLPTVGKFRLTVTAEYDGLEVTNFVRNIEAGILTNFTPSEESSN